jgi:hypothetical protein
MKEILIKNKEILERLNGFLVAFEKADTSLLPIEFRKSGNENQQIAVSEKYLEAMIKLNQATPACINGCDLIHWDRNPEKPMDDAWKAITNDISHNFTRELGAQQNALACYYPKGGFIGWHDNNDVPGWTLLFNWSETGNSFYRYRDCETHDIHTIRDKPGWSCKTGFYGHGPLSTFHCAASYEPRWSIAFYLRDKELRDQLLYDIEHE